MYLQDAREEYLHALRLGQREQRELTAAGQNPYPGILDDILTDHVQYAMQDLPVTEIPIERIVGIKSAGRTSAFTAGFLPLLDLDSEFAIKWISLCSDHLSDVGIRDPILCYEYLGDFYVQEGNKRVSVLKYFGAAKIPGMIRRVLIPESDVPRVKAYYEFLEFYKCAGMYDIQFQKPGDYAKLLAFLGKELGEKWTGWEKRTFAAYFHYFKEAFSLLSGKRAAMRAEDALLLWLQVHPFRQLGEMSSKELKATLSALWEDVVAGAGQEPVKLQTLPAEAPSGFFGRLIAPAQEHLNVAFVHQRDAQVSTWTQGHVQGSKYLEQVLSDRITVRSYFHADTPEQAEKILDQAVAEGAQAVFTTTPHLLRPTLKAAVRYSKVHFFNCSTDTPLSSVRSYYCRVFEGKFITGAIAGALAENDRIGYIGSYPILGVPASINAFALGAQMTNPRAKIQLEWSCLPGNPTDALFRNGVRVISNRDIPTQDPQHLQCGQYGTYIIKEDGEVVPLASPCWLWGKFYERILCSLLSGAWKKSGSEAVNYWWGIDSGVIDVELSPCVPESLRSLTKLLLGGMRTGALDPFCRRIVGQDGSVKNDGAQGFPPAQLLHMDWLCENVQGHIPEFEEILPISQALVRELGVHRERVPLEKEEGAL